MSRARILADYVSSGDELADKAPLASPAFTGTPTGITAAHLEAGVLPADVTGGSGLTALGTVTSGNLSNTAIVYPSGHVLQVVSDRIASTSISTSSTTYVTTGASLSITPSALSSKILITVSGGKANNPYVSQNMTITVYSNAGDIAPDANGLEVIGGGLNTLVLVPHSLEFLDSPNTTTEETYTCYFKNSSGQPDAYFNQSTGNVYMTLMEISG
jgi:hypothetical protein